LARSPEARAQHDLGIEHVEKAVEVARPSGGEEGVDHLTLPLPVCIRRRYLRAFDAAPGAARELACRSGRPIDHWRDLLER